MNSATITDADSIRVQLSDHNTIWRIATEVHKYVPGSLEWIAKQRDSDRDDVWAFVIGKGFAHLNMEQARQADDALYRELATQIMGYAPGSPQDIERRITEAQLHIDEAQERLVQATNDRQHWQNIRAGLEQKQSVTP